MCLATPPIIARREHPLGPASGLPQPAGRVQQEVAATTGDRRPLGEGRGCASRPLRRGSRPSRAREVRDERPVSAAAALTNGANPHPMLLVMEVGAAAAEAAAGGAPDWLPRRPSRATPGGGAGGDARRKREGERRERAFSLARLGRRPLGCVREIIPDCNMDNYYAAPKSMIHI